MKLDKNGINQLKNQIKVLESTLKETQNKKGIEAGGNNPWHDNGGYEQLAYQSEPALMFDIKHKKDILSKIELVAPHGKEGFVDIGDIVTLYDKEFDEEFKVQLHATYELPESIDDLEQASINSPMGEALWKSKVNTDIKYVVDNREFSMKVVKIDRIPSNLPIQ